MADPIQTQGDWHLDKNWRIAEIVTITAMVIGSLLYSERRLAATEKAVALLEANQAAQRDRDNGQDKVLSEGLAQIRFSVERINDKLDRYLERQYSSNPLPRK